MGAVLRPEVVATALVPGVTGKVFPEVLPVFGRRPLSLFGCSSKGPRPLPDLLPAVRPGREPPSSSGGSWPGASEAPGSCGPEGLGCVGSCHGHPTFQDRARRFPWHGPGGVSRWATARAGDGTVKGPKAAERPGEPPGSRSGRRGSGPLALRVVEARPGPRSGPEPGRRRDPPRGGPAALTGDLAGICTRPTFSPTEGPGWGPGRRRSGSHLVRHPESHPGPGGGLYGAP